MNHWYFGHNLCVVGWSLRQYDILSSESEKVDIFHLCAKQVLWSKVFIMLTDICFVSVCMGFIWKFCHITAFLILCASSRMWYVQFAFVVVMYFIVYKIYKGFISRCSAWFYSFFPFKYIQKLIYLHEHIIKALLSHNINKNV